MKIVFRMKNQHKGEKSFAQAKSTGVIMNTMEFDSIEIGE